VKIVLEEEEIEEPPEIEQ